MGRTNKILCIKNISIETLGNFENYLLSDGFEVKEILANPKIVKSQNLTDYDAVFILGGPMSVNDNAGYLNEEKKLIQSTFDLGIPIFGICLGSQLIASSCGGKVYQSPKKEIGWGQVRITSKGQSSIFNKYLGIKYRYFIGMVILLLYLVMLKFCPIQSYTYKHLDSKMLLAFSFIWR